MDRVRTGAVTATYLATDDEGAVSLLRLEPEAAPETVAFLERLDGASHLFTEPEHERVYSLERFFAEEYTLAESATTTMELPVYPEAMIAGASRGSEAGVELSSGVAGEEGTEGEVRGVDEVVPTATWRFVRSGELLYIFPGDGEEILVVRSVR